MRDQHSPLSYISLARILVLRSIAKNDVRRALEIADQATDLRMKVLFRTTIAVQVIKSDLSQATKIYSETLDLLGGEDDFALSDSAHSQFARGISSTNLDLALHTHEQIINKDLKGMTLLAICQELAPVDPENSLLFRKQKKPPA